MTRESIKKGIGWPNAVVLGFLTRMQVKVDDLKDNQLSEIEKQLTTCNCYPCRAIRWLMFEPKNRPRGQKFCDPQ